MRTAGRLWVLALAVLLTFPGVAVGQDADTREINAYRLTDAALAKYVRAARAMAPVVKAQDEEDEEDEEDDDSPSIAKLVAWYDAKPEARRAITGAGLTTREYVVFTFALFQAGMGAWMVEQQGWSKLPPEFARANVEFYQRHRASLDSLTAELKQRDDP